MQATYTQDEILEARRKAAKPMMWVGIVSLVMMWAGLTSAYIIRQAQGDWLYFDVPSIFYWSTLIIVLSSGTLWVAQRAIRQNNKALTAWSLLGTAVLGVVFGIMQYQGCFVELFDMGIYATGRESNAAGQYFNVLVWTHVAHVAGGIIALIFTAVKAQLKLYSSDDYQGVDLVGIYWHFVGILWIYLFLFILFIR